jgi:tetratricopeptide (TPR) repeat protein
MKSTTNDRHLNLGDRHSKTPPKVALLGLIAVPLMGLLLWFNPALRQIVQGQRQNGQLEAAYAYRFERSPVNITANLNQEIAFYKQRLQFDPSGGMNRALLAKTYLKMARATGEASWYLLAEQTAQDSLAKLKFHNDGAVLALAKVAIARHDFAQALQLSQQLEHKEDALALKVTANLAIGNLNQAKLASDRLVAQNPDLNALTLQALVNVAEGQDAFALQHFRQAIAAEEPEETGSSVWARTALGRFYFKRGQLDQAEQLYREALRILPNYAPALINSAELSIRRGDYQTAEQTYSRFFQISQNSPTVYDHVILRGMARLKGLQNDSTSAAQWRDRAEDRLRNHEQGFGHRRELARLLLERGRPQDLAEALTLMQNEVKVRQDAETLSTLAAVLMRLDRWQEAEQAMQTALRSGIRDSALFQQASTIAQALNKSSEAIAYSKAAQTTDPTFDTNAQHALGLGIGLLGLN